MSSAHAYDPPCVAHHTCNTPTYTWASPSAPYQFVVIVTVALLVLVAWFILTHPKAEA